MWRHTLKSGAAGSKREKMVKKDGEWGIEFVGSHKGYTTYAVLMHNILQLRRGAGG